MVEQKGGSNLLYLPLDKLIQQSSQAATPAPQSSTTPDLAGARTSTTTSAETGAAADQARTRDALRNRDRGDAR
jgi:membrane protease subunit HflK